MSNLFVLKRSVRISQVASYWAITDCKENSHNPTVIRAVVPQIVCWLRLRAWRPRDRALILGRYERISPSPKRPDRLWDSLILLGTVTFSTGVKRPGCQAYHKTWPCDKEKNAWSCISASPCVFMLRYLGLIKHKASLTAPFSVEHWNIACKWKAVEGSLPQSPDHDVLYNVSLQIFLTLWTRKRKYFFCIVCIARHGGVWWSSGLGPHIRNTITRWKWVICPGRFTPGEAPHATHWIAGWMDFRASLDALEMVKISSVSCKSNLNYPACHVIA